ncbi:MAG: glycosyltransferase, partial [Mucinivorans sp.]
MISIIVCSVSPDKLSKLKANVEATIGVEYEFVVVDNREGKYSICQAYNIGAQRAKYPYLCFAHEDIAFVVKYHWGELMMAQLAKPDTGVIGFAGATGKTKTLSTWVVTSEYVRSNFNEVVDGNTKIEQTNPYN